MDSERFFENTDSLRSSVRQISDTHSLMTLFDNKQQHKNLKLSRNAIKIGRPLGTSLVFVTGLANSGKSSLINCLLCEQDPKPAPESNKEFFYRRVTHDVNVQFNGFSLGGSIVMIDAPGFLENNHMEAAVNIASIRSLSRSLTEVMERNLDDKTLKCIPGSENVYPNVVVFAIRATENRLINNSCLKNSLLALKKVPNLIDFEKRNLLIVITNCVAFGKDREIFEVNLKMKQSVIQKVVRNVFEFDVNIIPLENCGEDYNLETSDDFFVLPNGEVSHKNLLKSIESLCKSNEDLVGYCIMKEFAKTTGNPASSKNLPYSINREDILEGYQFLAKVNNHGDVNAFTLDFFGRGYSPVKEKVCTGSLLTTYKTDDDQDLPTQLKIIDIDGVKWLVPKYCTVDLDPHDKEEGLRITQADKSEYEKFITKKYLDHIFNYEGQQLSVECKNQDCWISVAEKVLSFMRPNYVVKHLYHINLVKLWTDPIPNILSSELIEEINALPPYDTNEKHSKSAYDRFFRRWGSHIVNEINLGGYVDSRLLIDNNKLYNPSISQWDLNAKKYIRSRLSGLEKSISEVSFKLNGTFEPSDATSILSWIDNLATEIVELKYTMRLFPYYKLCNGQKSKDLESATKDFLTGKCKLSLHKQTSKDIYVPSF